MCRDLEPELQHENLGFPSSRMNINQRIAELGSGGLPRYNNKCNELARAVNWLLGMQTSAGPVSDGGRGPIINVPAASTQGSQPWLTDPDGDPAGWVYIYGIDLDGSVTGHTNALYKSWAWLGKPSSIATQAIPWMVDPNNNTAQWVQHDVCVNGQVVSKWFWGTP